MDNEKENEAVEKVPAKKKLVIKKKPKLKVTAVVKEPETADTTENTVNNTSGGAACDDISVSIKVNDIDYYCYLLTDPMGTDNGYQKYS